VQGFFVKNLEWSPIRELGTPAGKYTRRVSADWAYDRVSPSHISFYACTYFTQMLWCQGESILVRGTTAGCIYVTPGTPGTVILHGYDPSHTHLNYCSARSPSTEWLFSMNLTQAVATRAFGSGQSGTNLTMDFNYCGIIQKKNINTHTVIIQHSVANSANRKSRSRPCLFRMPIISILKWSRTTMSTGNNITILTGILKCNRNTK